MKPLTVLLGFILLAATLTVSAEEGGLYLEPAPARRLDVESLQRGARNFVNYCMGCHSAQYVRYNSLAKDLQITEPQLVANLMFAAQKPQETMTIAMRPDDAKRWFGVPPPDLSLIARSRGADY